MRLKATLLFFGALTGLARAQFYAPETEYHDIVQRTFPVEAARVLAWARNQADPKAGIDAVDFRTELTPARETVWTLTWSKEGKPVRTKIVRYPESLLTEGPKFYRDVFAQILGDDWRPQTAPPDNAASAFWQGANLAGVSRLEALRAARTFLAEKKAIERPADAARLAGILAHGALPIVGTQVTFDSVLLSRAAAWLCLAETMSREPGTAAWCPIEFLSGREKAAMARWIALPAKNSAKRLPPERFWDFLLRKPGAKEIFSYSARPENKAYALPLLAYLSHMDDLWAENTAEVGRSLFDEKLLERLYDYLPVIGENGAVGGGHFAAEGPGEFLSAWEQAAGDLAADDDGTGGRDLLTKVATKSPQEATTMLRRLAPVLNLGLDQGKAPLRPVAFATFRDLLVYGWEAAGVQFGTHHHFLEKRLGDPDSAQSTASAALGTVKGIEPFFEKPGVNPIVPLADPARLEFVGMDRVQRVFATAAKGVEATSADRLVRRVWLWKAGVIPALSATLAQTGGAERVSEILPRLLAEGGPLATVALLATHEKNVAAAVEQAGITPALLADIPWSVEPQSHEAWKETGAKGNLFAYAQALEKLTWSTGTPVRESYTFLSYLQCNALDSARRFYDQVVPFVTETVGFSNTTGPMRFALAWWEGDEAAMKRALQDSDTYSYSDLNLQINYALHSGDLAKAGEILEASGERYSGHEDEVKAIKAYLPLIPALKDPQHADHARALDSFPKFGYWNWTQWMLAREAKLTTEETIRFLGGEAPMESNRGFIAYLKKDKQSFERIFAKEQWSSRRCTGAFLALMRNDLLAIQPPAEQPDLKPADAKPLARLIAEAVDTAATAAAASDLDFSQYKTADEFWAAVQRLTEPPQGRPDSPEDGLRRMREWFGRQRTAANAFIKAFPNDARRYEARMIDVGVRIQLSRIGDRTVKLPEPAELQEVLSAPEASENARGEANFLLIMLDLQTLDLSSPHLLPPMHQRLIEFAEKYPQHPRAPYAASVQLQLLTAVETPGADNLLKKLAAHPNAQIAQQAAGMLAQRENLAALKKKPLELTFTAADGQPFDMAKLRGKVVLLDFWASWCGPCMADAPKVAAVYRELHDQGFEIVGINLDEDKAAMEAAAKRVGMPWTQAHDGKGWEGDLVKRFGVRSIPSTWLFDRTGKLREVGLRGEELDARVQRLLEEK